MDSSPICWKYFQFGLVTFQNIEFGRIFHSHSYLLRSFNMLKQFQDYTQLLKSWSLHELKEHTQKRNIPKDCICRPRLEYWQVSKILSKKWKTSLALATQPMNNNGVYDMVVSRKLLPSKKNTTAWPQLAKDHRDRPEGYWENVLWTDKAKIELFFLFWR